MTFQKCVTRANTTACARLNTTTAEAFQVRWRLYADCRPSPGSLATLLTIGTQYFILHII